MKKFSLILFVLGSLFTTYILVRFVLKPVSTWKSASDYSTKPGCYFMLIHWIGGCLVILIGPLQVNENIKKYKNIHIWLGRIYFFGCVSASVGGLLFIFIHGTVGGFNMDIAFTIYGTLFLIFGINTYRHACSKDTNQHQIFAIRTFALGIGSLLYRVYVFPLYFNSYLQIERSYAILWLNICAWLMFIPNMIIAECYLHWDYRRNYILLKDI